ATGATASNLVTWQQAVGSGILTTVNNKLQGSYLNLDDYGAVDRTGATDMGPIINTAISAAKSCAAGGNDVIRINAGKYLITTPVVPKSCVTIIGDGMGKTIFLTNHATPFIQTSGTQLVHFNLSGVTFTDSGS